MQKELKILKPDLAEARGRNGWFEPRNVIIWGNNGKIMLDVASRRQGRNFPITLCLDQSDANQIACAILGVPEGIVNLVRVPEEEQVALVVWKVCHIQQQAREMGKCLTLEQCNDILISINEHQSYDDGITWDTIAGEIEDWPSNDETPPAPLPACIWPDKDSVDFPCSTCPNFKKEGGSKYAKA